MATAKCTRAYMVPQKDNELSYFRMGYSIYGIKQRKKENGHNNVITVSQASQMTDLLPLVDLRDHPNEGCLVSIRDLWILQTTKIKYKKWRRELVSLLIFLRKQRFSSAVVTIIYYLETIYFQKKQKGYFMCAWSCYGSLYGKEK